MKPVRTINPGEVGVRVNRVTGHIEQLHEGWALVLPGIHELRRLSAARSDLSCRRAARRRATRTYPDRRRASASASTWRCATRSIRRTPSPSPRSCRPTSGASWSSRWSTASCIARSPSTRCARSSRPSAPRSRRRSRTELKPTLLARRHRAAQRVHRPRRPARGLSQRARVAADGGAAPEDALALSQQQVRGASRQGQAREGGRGGRARSRSSPPSRRPRR